MFVEGKSRTVFFLSDTLIYGISRDGSKNYNIRTCEHMILGQLRMGARQTNYAPLVGHIMAFVKVKVELDEKVKVGRQRQGGRVKQERSSLLQYLI